MRNEKGQFVKGHKQSNTGKTHFKKGVEHTDKWKSIMSEKMRGNTNGFGKGDVAWNKNMNGYMSGEKNCNWKGGISPLVVVFRKLEEYKQWRMSCLKRDWFKCMDCGSKDKLEVHHLKAFTKLVEEFLEKYNQFSPIEDRETLIRLSINYEPFWDIENGKTLCAKCHKSLSRIRNKEKD